MLSAEIVDEPVEKASSPHELRRAWLIGRTRSPERKRGRGLPRFSLRPSWWPDIAASCFALKAEPWVVVPLGLLHGLLLLL